MVIVAIVIVVILKSDSSDSGDSGNSDSGDGGGKNTHTTIMSQTYLTLHFKAVSFTDSILFQ